MMIKFTPSHVYQDKGTFGYLKENKLSLLETGIANVINTKGIILKCNNAACRNSDSIVSICINENSKRALSYQIKSYCCEDFNRQLVGFIEDLYK